METYFCIAAVEEALAKFGKPEIFNTDQRSQFTSLDFTRLPKQHDIAISMGGKGVWRDNVFVERLWRSVKYEEVYLKAYESVTEERISLAAILISTTAFAPIQRWASKHPTKPISTRHRWHRRHEFLRHPCSITPVGQWPPCVPLQEWQTQRQVADIPLIAGGNLFRQSRPPLTYPYLSQSQVGPFGWRCKQAYPRSYQRCPFY